MTAEVWLAEGLDALILARCSPLSPKTNRVLRHPAQQLLFANASLCPDGRSASGATIRSLYCANKMHARQMFVFSLKTFTLLCPDTSPPHTWYLHRFTSCTLTQRFCFSDYSTVKPFISSTAFTHLVPCCLVYLFRLYGQKGCPFVATRFSFHVAIDLVVIVMVLLQQGLVMCDRLWYVRWSHLGVDYFIYRHVIANKWNVRFALVCIPSTSSCL